MASSCARSRWCGSPLSCATTGARCRCCSASCCSASGRARWSRCCSTCWLPPRRRSLRAMSARCAAPPKSRGCGRNGGRGCAAGRTAERSRAQQRHRKSDAHARSSRRRSISTASTFVSNDRLRGVLEKTTATPQQVEEAVRVNTEARLRALKIGLLIMAGLAMLAIIPAGRLPNYIPGNIPAAPAPGRASREYGGVGLRNELRCPT